MKTAKKPALNKNLAKPSSIVKYGTAGYRLTEPDLNNVVCRASIIAYIRSATFAGKSIGLYITASHNPTNYNGVKFIDFNGNMLEESWETASDELVNAEDADFLTVINKIFRQNSNYSNMNDSIKGNVIIGRDTRESGVELNKNIREVLSQYKCNVQDYGIVSCPEMHFLIRKSNEKNKMVDKSEYLKYLHGKYKELKELTGQDCGVGIDTANGVGKIKIEEFLNLEPEINFKILNKPENNILNKECGADYIKTRNIIPDLYESPHILGAAFDGDVDRLVLFDSKNNRIFDGDAQAVFLAEFIRRQMVNEKLSGELGIVLSHYSNMAAMDWLRKHGFTVQLAQTGVKNFVKEAKKFDIGIYYEPNGHGSLTFSKDILDQLEARDRSVLQVFNEIFDPCIGDALANLLVFKTILKSTDEMKKYKENHSRLLTVRIRDKTLLKVDKNNVVLSPDIQGLIDEATILHQGRAFTRPSGTEDLVRIFAESSIEPNCDRLALAVAQIVYDHCEGLGPHPEIDYQQN